MQSCQLTGNEDKGSVNLVSSTGNLDFNHFQNFAHAIREMATLTSPIEEGHKSVLLCHLANIAQRTSGVLHCNPLNGHIPDNAEAQNLWSREYEKGWEFTV